MTLTQKLTLPLCLLAFQALKQDTAAISLLALDCGVINVRPAALRFTGHQESAMKNHLKVRATGGGLKKKAEVGKAVVPRQLSYF